MPQGRRAPKAGEPDEKSQPPPAGRLAIQGALLASTELSTRIGRKGRRLGRSGSPTFRGGFNRIGCFVRSLVIRWRLGSKLLVRRGCLGRLVTLVDDHSLLAMVRRSTATPSFVDRLVAAVAAMAAMPLAAIVAAIVASVARTLATIRATHRLAATRLVHRFAACFDPAAIATAATKQTTQATGVGRVGRYHSHGRNRGQ